ncbi:MAG: ATP-binding protein, partial [Ktedonobacterales bacterium]
IITPPSGVEKQVSVSTAPLRDASGRVIGAVAIYRDVTERRTLENRTHDVLDALLAMATAITAVPAETMSRDASTDESAPLPDVPAGVRSTILGLVKLAHRVLASSVTSVVVMDADTHVMQPLAITGLAEEDARRWWVNIQEPLEAFVSPPVADQLLQEELVVLDLANELSSPGQEYYGVRQVMAIPARVQSGNLCILTVERRNQPIFTVQEHDLAQAAVQLVALVIERDRLLREREEAQTQAQVMTEATRRMDEFLGIASHELRTPLTTISANVQIAERQIRTLLQEIVPEADHPLQNQLERTDTALTRASRQMTRLDRLVGDLIDTSRIQAGKLELRMEPCDLLAIARDCVQEQQVAWPDRAITLDTPRRATLPLCADADRIGQVITNFLTNALKYSAEDQPVAVRISVRGESARLAVRDTGLGLSQEQQSHLWERFYRVPGIEQQSGSGVGLGLGLHICKTLIARHGGQVGLESAPGVGSTFWFTLPLENSRP